MSGNKSEMNNAGRKRKKEESDDEEHNDELKDYSENESEASEGDDNDDGSTEDSEDDGEESSSECSTDDEEYEQQKQIKYKLLKYRPTLQPGDNVRILVEGKNGKGTWSEEDYDIVKMYETFPPTYKLINRKGGCVGKDFQEIEMLQVVECGSKDIKHILKTRKRYNLIEYKVVWVDKLKKGSSWIDLM